MLQIKNLTITHQKDLKTLLDDFSLVLNDGDKAVVIGEEGNGKSTLLKWIYDPRLVASYTESRGERVLGSERLAYLPQELPAADADKSVYEFFSEGDGFYDLTPGARSRLAADFGVSPAFFYREQPMRTLSGGEKVKAQLMRILTGAPTVLLLDEPSNDVDLATLALLERVIGAWKHIVLYISHDETLIEQTANTVIHIEQLMRKTKPRCTVARMPYRQYLSQRERQFAHQAQQALSDRREKRQRDEKLQRIEQSVAYAQATISRQAPHTAALLKKKMHTVKSMERRFAKEDEQMTALPQQEDVIFFRFHESGGIPAGKTVLLYHLDTLCALDGTPLAENIDLSVRGPERLCIVGANGAGKTTFLRLLAQELMQRADLRAEYMPQDYDELLDLDCTPVELLNRSGSADERTWVSTCLGALRYTTDEMSHPIRALSGGQRAKLLLLKMSLSGANVLLLDEPTRNFSPLSGPVIRRMLAEFPGAILSVSHDRKFIDEVCTRVLRLDATGLHPLR